MRPFPSRRDDNQGPGAVARTKFHGTVSPTRHDGDDDTRPLVVNGSYAASGAARRIVDRQAFEYRSDRHATGHPFAVDPSFDPSRTSESSTSRAMAPSALTGPSTTLTTDFSDLASKIQIWPIDAADKVAIAACDDCNAFNASSRAAGPNKYRPTKSAYPFNYRVKRSCEQNFEPCKFSHSLYRRYHLDESDELQVLVLQIRIDCPWHQQFFSNHNKTVKDHPKHA